jgi:hypothetical protein
MKVVPAMRSMEDIMATAVMTTNHTMRTWWRIFEGVSLFRSP